ncbi:MAG: copper chaperone Copz family protein [Pyrinomonadaceae bacterium]|jgi:hypothetical protein|nr:copper chaperone Copz family protein [Pyrinomonadaceae bacterium]
MNLVDCSSVDRQELTSLDVAEALALDPVNAPAPQDDPHHACRSCDNASRPVTRKTVLLMMKSELLDRVNQDEYRFCSDPECRVVYFSENGGPAFMSSDLRVRVGLKEKIDPVPLCYCFGFDEKDARDEISGTGTSTVTQRIVALIKQKMCACPAKNPSGACCLGEVNKAIKRLMADAADSG